MESSGGGGQVVVGQGGVVMGGGGSRGCGDGRWWGQGVECWGRGGWESRGGVVDI